MACVTLGGTRSSTSGGSAMETVVLVTVARHGGFSRRPVATPLRAAGHRVLSPSIPSLGVDDDPRGVTLTGSHEADPTRPDALAAVVAPGSVA
jgi:hypothetical protein